MHFLTVRRLSRPSPLCRAQLEPDLLARWHAHDSDIVMGTKKAFIGDMMPEVSRMPLLVAAACITPEICHV